MTLDYYFKEWGLFTSIFHVFLSLYYIIYRKVGESEDKKRGIGKNFEKQQKKKKAITNRDREIEIERHVKTAREDGT